MDKQIEPKFPFKYMTEVLSDVHKSQVALKQKYRCIYTKKVSVIMTALLPLMKKADDDFDSMGPCYQYADSFYEGTERALPEEMKVNLVLSLPHFKTARDKKKIQLEAKPGSPFLCNFNCPIKYPFLSPNNIIKVKSLIKFIESVVLKTIMLLEHEEDCPINNILIISNKDPLDYGVSLDINGLDIPIKLIPTFQFNITQKPKKSELKNLDNARVLGPYYCLVPKNFDDKIEWMMSFPQQEKRIFKSKYNLKYTMRLILLLRDALKFNGLTDEMIKTIFLFEAQDQNAIFWMSPRGDLLMYMLSVLNKHLDLCIIPNYWHRKYNMISEINTETLKNWSGVLNNVINDIKKNGSKKRPDVIAKYFTK